MLILTRRPGETIYIGEQVTVTVLGVVGNQVRFGIEAPRSITVDRAEIHERKKRAALGNAGSVNGNVCHHGNARPGHVCPDCNMMIPAEETEESEGLEPPAAPITPPPSAQPTGRPTLKRLK